MQSKKILFLLPIGPNIPMGGVKVIYDYCCRFVDDGYDITIIYAAYFKSTDKKLSRKIKSVAKYIYAKLFFRNGYSWYKKPPKITERFIWEINNNISDYDAYIATTVNTAPYLANLNVNHSKKYYFIQGFENFVVADEQFVKWTYRLPLKKIVISKWLSKIVEKEGQKCVIIPNGFNPKKYYQTIPFDKKDKYLISMLYHVNTNKDVNVGMKAVELAKKEIPELKLVLFGAYPKPKNLPEWVSYCQNPTAEKHLLLNNMAAIYLGCSRVEGWGLTIGEAMMCGQAVVCTDNDGYLEMAENRKNALVSNVGDSEALAANIILLVKDDELRIKLAKKGMEDIKKFNFDTSYDILKKFVI